MMDCPTCGRSMTRVHADADQIVGYICTTYHPGEDGGVWFEPKNKTTILEAIAEELKSYLDLENKYDSYGEFKTLEEDRESDKVWDEIRTSYEKLRNLLNALSPTR